MCRDQDKLQTGMNRNFYKHSSPQILLKLYNALILPHFNYCSSVWSPPDSSVNSSLLDSSNYFSLKVCSKIWSLNYHSLISHINIPSLVSRRNCSKLILLYKINNGLLYFPPNVLLPVPTPLRYSRHYNKLNFKPPFCSTQAYSSSFFPSVISLWNSLPDEAKTSSSLSSFRQIISYYHLKISYYLLLSHVYCISSTAVTAICGVKTATLPLQFMLTPVPRGNLVKPGTKKWEMEK